MPGGLPIGLQWPGGINYGAAAAGGTTATPGTTAGTKGAWVQLTAATTVDASWLLVCLAQASNTGNIFFDIGVGASGSELVLIPNLYCGGEGYATADYLIPCPIKAGSRIAIRCSSTVASDLAAECYLSTFGDAFPSAGFGGPIEQIVGSASAPVSFAVSQNAKGLYTQLIASTANSYAGFFLGFDFWGSGASSTTALVDIAVGVAGFEVIIVADWVIGTTAVTDGVVSNTATPFFPIPIPAGSRVAIRGAAEVANSLKVCMYGVR
jgi:hypothetical protein